MWPFTTIKKLRERIAVLQELNEAKTEAVELFKKNNDTMRVTLKQMQIARESQSAEIAVLKEKTKRWPGQKFYNPFDHKAPTVYLCAIWRDFYMVRAQNEAEPVIMSAERWAELYGAYVKMPTSNRNQKLLQ